MTPSHKVDWRQEEPNLAPVVNTQAEYYDWFTETGNAPRGILVSKPFHQVFSDPDGDELSYAVSIPEDHRHLVDELSIVLPDDVRIPGGTREGTYPRVFFRAEPDADWRAISPVLADPLTVTVTLTATDPGGLTVVGGSGTF